MVQIITFLFGVIYWKEIAAVALLIIVIAAIVSYIKNHQINISPHQSFQAPTFYSTCMAEIDELSGHEFENFCAFYLSENGYSDVELTPSSNDKGIDVLARKNGHRYPVNLFYEV